MGLLVTVNCYYSQLLLTYLLFVVAVCDVDEGCHHAIGNILVTSLTEIYQRPEPQTDIINITLLLDWAYLSACSSSTSFSLTSASMVRKERPSAAHFLRSKSLLGLMRNLLQASASFSVEPSARGLRLAS